MNGIQYRIETLEELKRHYQNGMTLIEPVIKIIDSHVAALKEIERLEDIIMSAK